MALLISNSFRPAAGHCARPLLAARPAASAVACRSRCQPAAGQGHRLSKRAVMVLLGGMSALGAVESPARADGLPGFKKDMRPVRSRNKVDASLYTDGPDGLKLYDVKEGEGAEVVEGDRVVVHYEAKWRGITFVTSRQGVGVTGGEPYGFDVGATGATKALRGLDVGVRGMRRGGVRKLIVPPELAYGDKGVGEIPGGATLDIEVELLSIKVSVFERAGLKKPNAA
eukprot:jgi/Ulvmu1/7955/UM004_0188.1